MIPQKLLIAAWVSGLVVLGNVVACIVLARASSRIPEEYSTLYVTGAVIGLFLILIAIGGYFGNIVGRGGIVLRFTVPLTIPGIFTFVLLMFLLYSNTPLSITLFMLTMLLGPFYLGWTLGSIMGWRCRTAAGLTIGRQKAV